MVGAWLSASQPPLSLTSLIAYVCAGAHLAWKKGVCHGRAAFDITFQHKITFSLKTRNRLMNFAICPSLIN